MLLFVLIQYLGFFKCLSNSAVIMLFLVRSSAAFVLFLVLIKLSSYSPIIMLLLVLIQLCSSYSVSIIVLIRFCIIYAWSSAYPILQYSCCSLSPVLQLLYYLLHKTFSAKYGTAQKTRKIDIYHNKRIRR